MRLTAWFVLPMTLLFGLAISGPTPFAPIPGETRHSVIGFDPMSPIEFQNRLHEVVPVFLLIAYHSSMQNDPAARNAGIAMVADGAALKSLAAGSVGMIDAGGLPADIANVHEVRLVGLSARSRSNGIRAEIKWTVIGIEPGSQHAHVNGKTYAAKMFLAPADKAWKITEFEQVD